MSDLFHKAYLLLQPERLSQLSTLQTDSPFPCLLLQPERLSQRETAGNLFVKTCLLLQPERLSQLLI